MERYKAQIAALHAEREVLLGLIESRRTSAVSHGSHSVQDAFSNSGDSELGDAATDAYEQALDVSMLDKYRHRLTRIDAALARHQAGQYGTCIRCRQPIGTPRLDAIPETAYCVACERAVEAQH